MNTQPSLFDMPVVARPAPLPAYQPGSETSRQAAAAIRHQTGGLRGKVLEYLRQAGPSTQEDIAKGTSLRLNTVNPRINELARDGMVRRAGRGKTSSGRMADLWEAA